MANTIKSLFLVLLTFGCAARVEESAPCETTEPKPPVCAPVQKCMAREAGYIWGGLSTSKVGECVLYKYVCVPNEQAADESCEQRWETVCAPGDLDYDPNYGERGE